MKNKNRIKLGEMKRKSLTESRVDEPRRPQTAPRPVQGGAHRRLVAGERPPGGGAHLVSVSVCACVGGCGSLSATQLLPPHVARRPPSDPDRIPSCGRAHPPPVVRGGL